MYKSNIFSVRIKRSTIDNIGDYLLSISSVSQIALMMLQCLLIDSGTLSVELAGFFRVVLSMVIVFISMIWIINRNIILTLKIYTLIFFLFFVSIILDNRNIEYVLSEGFRFTLPICLPIFLAVASIKNKCIFYRVFMLLSLLLSIIAFVYFGLYVTGNLPQMERMYNMTLGYSILPIAQYLLITKKIHYILLSLCLCSIILIVGSRGPLVPIILMGGYIVLFNVGFKWRLIVFLLIIVLASLIPFALSWLETEGINSRTIDLFLNGEIARDSGRNELYDLIVIQIMKHPLLGLGVFSDRIFTDGAYCHNLFLELFIHFGCIIPIFFISVLIFKIHKVYNYTHLEINKLTLIALGLNAFVPLLVSSSYLVNFNVPLFLGFLYMLNKDLKKKIIV